jgi:hypothetical protein
MKGGSALSGGTSRHEAATIMTSIRREKEMGSLEISQTDKNSLRYEEEGSFD